MLGATSRLKGEKDWLKYETARSLHTRIDKIRADYQNDWSSKEMRLRQRSVALYFIDKLALRAGNEKDSDEAADTVSERVGVRLGRSVVRTQFSTFITHLKKGIAPIHQPDIHLCTDIYHPPPNENNHVPPHHLYIHLHIDSHSSVITHQKETKSSPLFTTSISTYTPSCIHHPPGRK